MYKYMPLYAHIMCVCTHTHTILIAGQVDRRLTLIAKPAQYLPLLTQEKESCLDQAQEQNSL